MTKIINYGISEDLQTDIRYEPNACKGYVMDISLGCPHHCIYCLFSPLEILVYKLKNPGYKDDILLLKLDKFLAREDFPPAVYMCYSSDPLGNPQMIQNTITVLKKLFLHDTSVFFISKAVFTDEIIEVIRQRPDLMEIQVGITSCSDQRNKIIEPGAPPYGKRLENLEKLSEIKGLGSLTVRIDPMMPSIDDTDENIQKLLDDISRLGVKEVVMGYVILTKSMREGMKRNEFLKSSAAALTEKTQTISEQELFSIPFAEKEKKFYRFQEMCKARGIKMAVCGCKDQKLKTTSLEWICHPFNRKRRQELAAKQGQSGYVLEFEHLK
jgi:DNA repair photolyase